MRMKHWFRVHLLGAFVVFGASACGGDDSSGSVSPGTGHTPDAAIAGDGGDTQEGPDGSDAGASDGASTGKPDATLGGDADAGAVVPSEDGGVLDATVPSDAGDATAPQGLDARSDDGDAADARVEDAGASDAQGATSDDATAEAASRDAALDAGASDDAAQTASVAYAYVGTYLGGIWPYSIVTSTGVPTLLGDAAVDFGAEINSLAATPSGTLLYAVDGAGQGAIRGYRIGVGGALSPLTGFPMSMGAVPIALAIDAGGVFAYVSAADGIHVYEIIYASGTLHEVDGSPFARTVAPYYVAVDPSGRFLYGAAAGGIHIYSIAVTGTLTETSQSPAGGDSLVIGALVFHPSGRFLYASGAGGSGLNGWSVDPTTGGLMLLAGSPFSLDVTSDIFATDLAIDRTGESAFATSNSDGHLTAFDVDASTGFLSRRLVLDAGGAAYSVAVDPGGRFVFVGIDDADIFGVDAFDPVSGTLTPVQGSPFTGTGLQPQAVIVDAP